MKNPIALLTVKDALFQDVVRRQWQPARRFYMYSADGCGDNLYRTASDALKAYKVHQLLNVVINQHVIDTEQD